MKRAMTATFSHRKTVMARTAKKEDTSKPLPKKCSFIFTQQERFLLPTVGSRSRSIRRLFLL
jgi:hypothetical protein